MGRIDQLYDRFPNFFFNGRKDATVIKAEFREMFDGLSKNIQGILIVDVYIVD